jgi:hypothetical protein
MVPTSAPPVQHMTPVMLVAPTVATVIVSSFTTCNPPAPAQTTHAPAIAKPGFTMSRRDYSEVFSVSDLDEIEIGESENCCAKNDTLTRECQSDSFNNDCSQAF